MLRVFIRQFLIFITYLAACSYFLFNHSGGADMAFILFLDIFVAIHFLVTIILVYNHRSNESIRRWNYLDISVLIGIVGLFFVFADLYLDFMWWFTSIFQ
mgnify:CR=1 FL=1